MNEVSDNYGSEPDAESDGFALADFLDPNTVMADTARSPSEAWPLAQTLALSLAVSGLLWTGIVALFHHFP